MNAAITPRLTLEEVAEHFAQWRSHKKTGERIPEHLWREAIGLLGAYPVSQVTRTLRLGGRDLNRRRRMMESGKGVNRVEGENAFVEIDRALVAEALRPGAPATVMELQRPDGLRLRVEPATGAEMLALLERFLGV
jgi:hypothetical protein